MVCQGTPDFVDYQDIAVFQEAVFPGILDTQGAVTQVSVASQDTLGSAG